MLLSYLHTYPDTVESVAWVDGDWTITVGGQPFYWSEGRILPEDKRQNWSAYRPHAFAVYPASVPNPQFFSSEEIEAVRRLGSLEAQDTEDHDRSFQAALYGGIARLEIENNLERVVFLDHRITVHSRLVEPLGRVEEHIRASAQENRETAEFLSLIRSIGGYNWRDIQGTARMSYHSWGLAVDILCQISTLPAVYWLWERGRNEDWALVPLSQRWAPPDAVIEAFEQEGFIWGGKWALYDNMHFEYRPELHEINRILASQEEITQPLHTALLELHHILPGN